MRKATTARVRSHFTTAMPSVAERKTAGKALREEVPHARHAEYRPAARRADPVAILERQAKSRLPELVPIRYARMLANPFAFLRGAAAVMVADLAPTPTTGVRVQACGDMHVANFGFFGSAERNLIFGISDFDETLPAPWEWDVKRLAASAVVVARFLGADRRLAEESARAAVRSYRERMREYAPMGYLDVWYARIDERDILATLSAGERATVERLTSKARERGNLHVLGKMTELVNDRRRIVEEKPLVVRETRTADGQPIAEAVAEVLSVYLDSLAGDRKRLLARYRVADVARKVVGVGSVGTRCWVVLMTGNGDDDPLFLQYKEAQASVLAPYTRSSPWACEGERVVFGQRLIQGAPDIFLGWGIRPRDGGHFYVRQLRDMKGGVEFVPGTTKVKQLPEYCRLCGWALALAHAKSGDAATIAGYLGKSDRFDRAVVRFAVAYADQTDRDHAALVKAAKAKRIRVASRGS